MIFITVMTSLLLFLFLLPLLESLALLQNNECRYMVCFMLYASSNSKKNGFIWENGIKRQANAEEAAKVAEYQQQMAKYQKELQKRMNRWDPFWPAAEDHMRMKPPSFPCFYANCSSESGNGAEHSMQKKIIIFILYLVCYC